MFFITRWFKKQEPDDYETILSNLALDIQKRQTRLSEIRLRERRATLLVTLYALAAWLGYLTLWFTSLLPNLVKSSFAVDRIARGAPVVVGPIFILFTRRIVQIWYTRIADAEEKTLKKLLQQQRAKVEEIKKKTNYYSTRNLLERYDESPSADSPLRRRVVPSPAVPPQSVPQTPAPTGPQRKQPLPAAPQAIPSPRKQWYDKVADALLGDDEAAAPSTAASRYALICEKCFAHNGLVKESLWEDTQYTCPKCGHFNSSVRSRKLGSRSSSPARPSNSPPVTPPQPGRQLPHPNNSAPVQRQGVRKPSPLHEEEGAMEVDQ